MLQRLPFIVILLSLSCAAAEQQEPPQNHAYRAEQLVSGLEHPWGMALLPGGDMLVTERPGRLRQIRNGKLLPPVDGLPTIATGGQGGLLDVALHPNYPDNGRIYLSYSKAVAGGKTTALLQARLAQSANRLFDLRDIFIASPAQSTSHHFGSRIAFGKDGKLYLTIGDRGHSRLAQQLDTHMGKVIRLNLDGSPPADNPFVHKNNAMPEIYTYGHRNSQGMIRAPDGSLWLHEHGPRGGDEINKLAAGNNYGWPVITYGRAYSGFSIGEGTSKPGMEQPLWYWVPSIAPSGMLIYHGQRFPELQGDLLIGSLKFHYLERLRLHKGKIQNREKLIANLIGRIRDIELGDAGEIYLLNDQPGGGVYQLIKPGW